MFRWTRVLGSEMINTGGRIALKHSVNYGPPNALAWTGAGRMDPNLAVGSLCAALRTDASFGYRIIGMTSETGTAPAALERIPYSPALAGLDVYLQSYALDMTQPGLSLALTQGVRIGIPLDPIATDVAHAFSYPTLTGSPFAMVEAGGIVALLQQ